MEKKRKPEVMESSQQKKGRRSPRLKTLRRIEEKKKRTTKSEMKQKQDEDALKTTEAESKQKQDEDALKTIESRRKLILELQEAQLEDLTKKVQELPSKSKRERIRLVKKKKTEHQPEIQVGEIPLERSIKFYQPPAPLRKEELPLQEIPPKPSRRVERPPRTTIFIEEPASPIKPRYMHFLIPVDSQSLHLLNPLERKLYSLLKEEKMAPYPTRITKEPYTIFPLTEKTSISISLDIQPKPK